MAASNQKLIVILDNIRSALNVGAIFRTCDAAGVQMLYLCGITAYPPHNKIPKTALGAVDSVSWKHVKYVKDAIKECREKYQTNIVAIETGDKATDMWKYSFKGNTAVILGNEVTGIEPETLAEADNIVSVKMFGKKESLNVATTCGVVLYEALRQFHQ